MKTKINMEMKMEKLVYKPKLLLLLTAALLSFSLAAQEVSKDYHKEFKADKNTTLDLNNRYGDISITAWDKDQVVIDVKVTVKHSDKEKAQKYLDKIDIKFNEDGNTISVKTVIEDNFNFSGWGSNREFKINYTIRMPFVSNLTLANRYGNTDIDELRGLVNLDIKYGGIEIDKLTRGNEKPFNRIAVAYGKGNITEAGWLDVYIRYTNTLSIDKSQALLVDSRYSKLKVGETSSIVADAKYDSYNIDKINNLVLQTGYTNVNAGSLTKKLSFEGSYGSLTVDEIPSGFESIDVDVRYSGVRLGIAENASYKLDAESSYGSIKYNEDNLKFTRRIIENTSSEISGVIGKEESTSSTVKVKTAYGTVKLY
jgi:hypothetical protein